MEKIYDLFLDDESTPIGKLYANFDSEKEVYSFEYNELFISKYLNFFLDPDLYTYKGRQYPNHKLMFGFISDLMPDRWGRTLLERSERAKAKKLNQNPKRLYEIDYLIKTLDVSRTGSIRIKEENGQDFLAPPKQGIPPYVSLRKLEQASLDYEDDFYNDDLIQLLLTPASSLGGARPKANIYDTNGELYIAKFPSKKDDYDVALFEKVVNELARMCDINVPSSLLEEKKNKYGSIYLSKRFDRNKNERIHYASAMTLLGANDADKEKHSYLEILNLINLICKDTFKNKKELFKRIIFNILINNCDDHLRNHGFIYRNGEWSLSPMFDVNISLDSSIHALKFVNDDEGDITNIFEVAKYFNFDNVDVDKEIKKMSEIINNNFEKLAKKYSSKESEIKLLKAMLKTSE